MTNVETIQARDLMQNDRVHLYRDEMPYLVDAVSDTKEGVSVRFSSGDVIEYAADAELSVRL